MTAMHWAVSGVTTGVWLNWEAGPYNKRPEGVKMGFARK